MLFLGAHAMPADPGHLEALDAIGRQVGQFIARRRVQEDLGRFIALSPSVIYALRFTETGLRAHWVSDNLAGLTGYSAGDSIHGSWWRDHLHPDDRARVLASRQQWELTGHAVQEFRFRRKDGEYIWLRDEKKLVRDSHGRPSEVIGVWTDISDRRSLEMQLLQAQKMEAIGHLSGGIAHDFNNILGAVIGNAQLASADLSPEHPASESVSQILKAGRRAKQLVRQILTFARQNNRDRHRVDLSPIVEESVRLLRATLPSGISVRMNVADGSLPLVLADETQVQQIILNLGTNSWHAIEGPTGLIAVDLSAEQVSKEQAALSPDLRPGRYLRLRLRDTGKGMRPELISRIFDPFFTTKEPGKGTGLGLSVVHGIMKSHEGAILVESAPGKGCLFSLYFPEATGGDAKAFENPPPIIGAPCLERVLVADDEESMRIVTERLLTKLGYRVTACSTGESAVMAFLSQPAAFAVVLTDLNMPGMSGIEVAAAINRSRPDVPVVLSSGFISEDLRRSAETAGVVAILNKPASLEELGMTISNALRRNR